MAELGWTRTVAVDEPRVAALTRAFAFTDAGSRIVTVALAELARRKAARLATIKGYTPSSAPARVAAACDRLGTLSMTLIAALIIARAQAPAGDESRAATPKHVAALEEIARGLERTARAVADAIAVGPDSADGGDWLDRSAAALDYVGRTLPQLTGTAPPASSA